MEISESERTIRVRAGELDALVRDHHIGVLVGCDRGYCGNESLKMLSEHQPYIIGRCALCGAMAWYCEDWSQIRFERPLPGCLCELEYERNFDGELAKRHTD